MVPNFPSRVLHDLGLAAWFGGTLANVVALNRAAGQAPDPSSAGRVANTGWDAWTPINAVAIGATWQARLRLRIVDNTTSQGVLP